MDSSSGSYDWLHRRDSRVLTFKVFWKILKQWVYEYISTTMYPKAQAQSHWTIAKLTLTQLAAVSVALDCVTWAEICNNPYDRGYFV